MYKTILLGSALAIGAGYCYFNKARSSYQKPYSIEYALDNLKSLSLFKENVEKFKTIYETGTSNNAYFEIINQMNLLARDSQRSKEPASTFEKARNDGRAAYYSVSFRTFTSLSEHEKACLAYALFWISQRTAPLDTANWIGRIKPDEFKSLVDKGIEYKDENLMWIIPMGDVRSKDSSSIEMFTYYLNHPDEPRLYKYYSREFWIYFEFLKMSYEDICSGIYKPLVSDEIINEFKNTFAKILEDVEKHHLNYSEL